MFEEIWFNFLNPLLPQKTCRPSLDPRSLQVFSQTGAIHPRAPVQFSEPTWSQVYQQPVDPNTQSGFLLDLKSQLTLPIQPVNPVSEMPVAPADSTQRNVPFSQWYQQQYRIHPKVSPGTVHANRPADAQKPEESEPVFQQVILPSLVNQPPSIPDSPLIMQQNSGGMPPAYCSQSCPPGSSNCCFQLAFHQHYHHIVPGVPGNAPFIYTGLPSLTHVASPSVQPQSPPAENGAFSQPPEGSLNIRTELPISTPLIRDSNLLYWLTASQRPYRIQTSHVGQTPRYQHVKPLTQSLVQSTDPPPNNQGPMEATLPQRLGRPRYIVNPSLGLSSSPAAISPQQLYSTGTGHPSRAYMVQRSPPSQYYHQALQDVQRNEPVNLAQRHSGQRRISVQSLPKGV